MSTRIVVVGGGTAGARLAQRLPVTLLGEEPHTPYNRVLLADVLAGRYAPEVIALPGTREPARLGVRAVRIDRAARTVECADGSLVGYDRLVLATGSNPVLPPLRGLRGPGGAEPPEGVHAFRTLDDCLALRDRVRPGVRAVVVGGGLLGVSAARALAALGAEVVLTQQGERLMERQLDATASHLLREHVESLGVEVHTECRVSGLRQRDGEVTAVELADGFVLDARVVVLACGVRPRVALAREAGLAVATGIVVDDELRTSDPYIHAIGDCAEHGGRVYGLAGPALDQADALTAVLLAETAAPAPRGPSSRGAERPSATGVGAGATPAETVPATGVGAGATPAETVPANGVGVDAAPTETVPATGVGAGAAPTETVPATGYTGTRALTRLTLGGARPLDLAAFGDTTALPGDHVVQLTDATRRAHRKVVVRGDRLVGGVLLGDLAAVGTLARAWEGDEALPDEAPLLHLLTHDGGSS
ncbi:assimilatory nitrate reductase electron transfer subunit [Streptomyces sp. PvR006]|uniref:FAD-dependent oxidoreductase n=1 Tax=Streptomyces sp. PvR006 TaxID=2817860 RepID=UPI001AE76931|nr:FAD-dependent oxidoreductase [Streptomyces sp. PvR006]MBP2582047.1 assimilatory nitrate reductase electron transfer subunit [Streptomyces sp. PvR006]